MRRLFWLSDEQWVLIKPHLPYRAAGKRREDDRRIISGIIHVLQSGCRWRDCPPEYGPSTTIYNRYNRWSRKGIWQYMFAELTAALAGTPEQISIDTSHVKAHRCAAGGKGGLLYRPSAAPREAATPRFTP
jgi:transposase